MMVLAQVLELEQVLEVEQVLEQVLVLVRAGAGAVINVESTTSSSAVNISVETDVVVISASTLCTLSTGTLTPLILASRVSKTLTFEPALAVVPANLTPFSK